MENSTENSPERILTKKEVVEKIQTFVENYEVHRELSDENGLYLFEVVVPGEKEGETIEYMYLRKGDNPGRNRTPETTIFKNHYDKDGIGIGGVNISSYDESLEIWKDVE